MSLSFVVPQSVSQSWRASTLPKRHGTVKPSEVSASLLGSAAVGGVAAATVAAAVASHNSRGSQKRGTCINIRAFENELGVQAPVGFWDPLGLTKDGDTDVFKRRRATELKHGRLSMIACIGYITPEFFRWPGFCSPSNALEFNNIPNGLKALDVVPGSGWFQMLLFGLAIEKGLFVQDPARAPGDFANGGVLGVPNKTTLPPGDERNRRLNAELANGRLAMFAIIGMFYQDGLTGSAWGDWSVYDGAVRAFENELGVQDPVGFWDPLRFALDGDEAVFRRRRESEIKHGRISMIATIGYIVPGMGYRFGGLLSPSQNINFESIPHGLKAINAIPTLGLLQFLLFCGFIETGFYRADPERAPGDFKNGGILGVPNATGPMPNAEERKRKLNSELANGRLAMMAIIGLFFQDGLTGSAWGDWASYTASPLRALESGGGLHAKRSILGGRGERAGRCAVSLSATESDFEAAEAAPDGAVSPAPSGAATATFDVTMQYGVTAPTGKPGELCWDPAGLARNIDGNTFRQYRSAELKHGRISMMALIGLVVQHSWHLPKLADAPSGIGAAGSAQPSSAAFALVLMFAGLVEYNSTDEGREPGDYGDPFDLIDLVGFDRNDPEELALWKNRELNHCRLAMVGFFGCVMAEYATGLDAIEQWRASKKAWNRTIQILSFPENPVPSLENFG